MKSKLKGIAKLIRFDKPIGTFLLLWPTLSAFFILTNGHPSIILITIFCLGTFFMRSAGCVINDYFDRDIDGKVARTKDRPLITGEIKPKEALLLFIVLLMLSASLLIWTNKFTVIVALLGAGLTILYPLTKRFFIGPQLFLGITFNPTIIVYALTEKLSNPTIFYLYFAIAAMTIAYDSFYGLCDEADDRHLGINSTPLWWGKYTLKIIALFQIISMCLLGMIGWVDRLDFYWFVGVMCMGGFFLYQHNLASHKEYLLAFKNNHWMLLFILITAVACYSI